MRKIIKIISTILVVITALFGLHSYAKHLVHSVIEEQVAQREDEIRTEMRQAMREALKDERTQKEVQQLLNDAVAKELETNGEVYVTNIIRRRYPRLLPFLRSMEQSE